MARLARHCDNRMFASAFNLLLSRRQSPPFILAILAYSLADVERNIVTPVVISDHLETVEGKLWTKSVEDVPTTQHEEVKTVDFLFI